MGFQPFRFFRGKRQARLGTLGKFFQRPLLGLRGLCGFLPLPAPLHRLRFPLLVGGKPFRFLRGEVGSGLVQPGKFLQCPLAGLRPLAGLFLVTLFLLIGPIAL